MVQTLSLPLAISGSFNWLRLQLHAPLLFGGALMLRDRRFMAAMLAGCLAIGTIVGCLVTGSAAVMRTGNVTQRLAQADLWLVPAKADSDASRAAIDAGVGAELARILPGMKQRRFATGMLTLQAANHATQLVKVVGAEGFDIPAGAFFASDGDLARLGLETIDHVPAIGARVRLGGDAYWLAGTTRQFAALNGAPTLLMPLATAQAALGLTPEQVTAIAAKLDDTVAQADLDLVRSVTALRTSSVALSTSPSAEDDKDDVRSRTAIVVLGATALAVAGMTGLFFAAVWLLLRRHRAAFAALVAQGAKRRDISIVIMIVTGAFWMGATSGATLIAPMIVDQAQAQWPWLLRQPQDLMLAVTAINAAMTAALIAAQPMTRRFRAATVFAS